MMLSVSGSGESQKLGSVSFATSSVPAMAKQQAQWMSGISPLITMDGTYSSMLIIQMLTKAADADNFRDVVLGCVS